ncbi:glutamate--cysteine ligase [Tsukamurella spumae]|uniref:Putative glutamate--cysteine ligase 2 n=1 Tax=Tsukamurella spumae TaxID=44753 RepID=A0A846X018_9ACTN|nr:glutamate--cysteine ligase [Tsukamurella spumae]NKY18451.1 glutamate--cysteine ligase [Tsukamurella spumae]
METVAFEASPRPTIGVEWEFALVDRETADLVSRAGELFDGVRASRPDIAHQVHSEMLRNTVEVVTGVCENTAEAMADLARVIGAVRETADPMGVDLFGAGTHPFAQWNAQQLTENPRYDELIARTQWWGRQMLIWGVHVHVGVNHRDKVLPIISALLNHYPHLLALSASSPMWGGHDTGYASTRAMMFQQLPTAGLPFQFEQWSEFERFVHDQKTTGIIDHLNEIRWDIRPACHLGTIEVRICDGMSSFAELEAVVALIHCLVVWLDARLDAGETLPTLPPWHVQENKWRAARYGLDAIIIQDADNNERLVTEDLDDLLEQLAPIARRLGCSRELAAVAAIPRRGASYQRQRAVAEGVCSTDAYRDVVRSVTRELILP